MNYVGIFQGGGIKGIAHIGALVALEERGFNCVMASGTSVGAIIASLIASGYKPHELKNIVDELNLLDLRKKDKFINIFKEFGVFSSTPLEVFLNKLYKEKGVFTYRDLKMGTNYKLKVVATDITKRRMIVFPTDLKDYNIDKDSFSVAKSVVMSATYPFFYKPIKLGSSLIVDGAISNNFFLNAFNEVENIPKIGFNLIGEKGFTKNNDFKYLIRIPIPKIFSMNFKINKNIQKAIYLAGYNAGKKFINDFFK